MPDKPKRAATSGTRKGNGAGWGGPAKGAGSEKPKQDFSAVTNAQGHNATTSAEDGNRNVVRRATRESMMMVLERIAEDPDAPAIAQITAAEKWLDRTEGKSVSRNINVNADDLSALSDADIAAELARLGSAETEAAPGAAPSPRKAPVGGVVH